MTPPAISQLVQPVIVRYRAWQMWRGLAICWTLTGIGALALIAADQSMGWRPELGVPSLLGFAFVSSLIVWVSCRRFAPDLQWLARQVEEDYPELNSLLLAAVEQKPDENGCYSYLQQRVIREAIEHAAHSRWSEKFSRSHKRIAVGAHWLALAAALALIVVYVTPGLVTQEARAETVPGKEDLVTLPEFELKVDPGDAEIERGSSLVVVVRFGGERVPDDVGFVMNPGTEASRIITMVKSMQDPVFGTTLTGVDKEFVYQVAFAGGASKKFTVKVFEYPKLERSDAEIEYPAYTGLEKQKIENTRRVTAVEESKIQLQLELNKPVEYAALVSPDETLELKTDEKKAVALLEEYTLTRNRKFKLVLRDADGRTNKVPSRFVFVSLNNREPEVKFLFPRGDQKVSALEEIQFEIQAYDDFGLDHVGFSYRLAGQDSVETVLATNVPARKKLKLTKMLALEDIDAQPDNLITYYLWAEDTGPNGKKRRRESDMFFAEVRRFDETWAEVENEGQQDQQQQQQGQGQQGGAPQLAELLKEITFAGWKLRRQEYESENNETEP
ncbi:MAG: hypothetical protein ACPGVU_01220 [Limisphaerales bacterium]